MPNNTENGNQGITVRISVNEISLIAKLDASPTAQAVAAALPIDGTVNVWGDEIYFEIPVAVAPADDARAGVDVGDVAYWPPGRAMCIFFGPTPVSTDERPRAYSPVNVFGRVSGDASALKAVPDGAAVSVTLHTPQE